MNYIPLNIKTHYELLTSIIKLEDLIKFAKDNNITSLAITDSNMYNDLSFYNECKKNNIRPIIGVCLEVDNIKFNLYAKNYNGYQNLCEIVTEKNINDLTLDYIKKYKDNIKCMLMYESINSYNKLIDIFEDLYITYKDKEEKNSALLITENVVYSNICYALNKEDLEYVKYLWMIKEGKTISSETNYNLETEYLKENINEEDIKTTIEFSKDLNLEFPSFKYELPKYKEEDSNTIIRSLCKKGLYKRLNGNITKPYVDRLEYELSVIENMGYTDYFLIVYDFILYAKKNGILVGPGRGSGAGSLVCFCLGIIDIDPLKFNLIFERFLNPERITMPDIDVDFEHSRRDEVVNYVKEKYGTYNVANIITFGTLLPKQVIRDVGRVLEIDLEIIDKLCKEIKDKETFSELEKNSKFMNVINSSEKTKELLTISKKLVGLKRHTSIHAAGVVISKDKLTTKMPLVKSGDNILTAYSMEYMEELGLLKMDFLALRNLTIVDNMINSIFESTGKKINLYDIPLNDKLTLDLFKNADTIGIFQFESNGMKDFLKKLKPDRFDDIIAAISLYRPGPRDNIDSYVRRKQGKEKITYMHPLLEPILKDTYGIIIYQEQIIEILKTLADYTYSEADNIRRAMSKKKEDIILAEKENFIKRLKDKNIDNNTALNLFNLILKFSNYGFNKSHSVAYAYICYYMAYLKANYKESFITNIMNINIGSEVKTKEYIDEARILKIFLEKPNVLRSEDIFKLNNKKILLPLSMIKNVGKEAIGFIMEQRNTKDFEDIYDFIRRVYSQKVNKRVLINLIESGALDVFGKSKKTLIENLDNLIDYASLCKDMDETLVLKPVLKEEEEYSKEELMTMEYNAYGFYLSMHPVTKFKRDNMVVLKDVSIYFDRIISTILLIENIKTINTKNKERMMFLTLSDEYSKIEGVIFPNALKTLGEFRIGNVIRINAKVEKRISQYQLVINSLEVLK